MPRGTVFVMLPQIHAEEIMNQVRVEKTHHPDD
jgi:hypothetical protein